MIVLGLTGSIGMGKSTTAAMFRDLGIPVHDADETVHDLYERELVQELEAAFPGVSSDGRIDRRRLSEKVVGKPEELEKLEAIVHPAVRAREEAFLREQAKAGVPLVVLDIPLLFETGGNARVDKVAVVTAPSEVQRARVLSRPDMTVEKFEKILARQMPDSEKRRRADFTIETGKGLEHARRAVERIIGAIKSE